MKRRIFSYLLVLSLGVLTSCKSVRVLPNKAPVKRVDLKVLTAEIAKAEENISTFRARIKAVYNDQNANSRSMLIFALKMGRPFG